MLNKVGHKEFTDFPLRKCTVFWGLNVAEAEGRSREGSMPLGQKI